MLRPREVDDPGARLDRDEVTASTAREIAGRTMMQRRKSQAIEANKDRELRCTDNEPGGRELLVWRKIIYRVCQALILDEETLLESELSRFSLDAGSKLKHLLCRSFLPEN